MGVVRRFLEPKLLDAIRGELVKRGVDFSAVNPQQLLLEVCHVLDSWHITEDAGNNRSRSGLVEMLQETIGGHNAEAYCMSTQQSITAAVEQLLGLRSALPASEGCLDVFSRSVGDPAVTGMRVFHPMDLSIEPGDLAVWQRLGSDKGHVGRVVSVGLQGKFRSFEGNTSGAPGIDRDGGGCFMKDRDRSTHGNMVLRGFIRESFHAI